MLVIQFANQQLPCFLWEAAVAGDRLTVLP